ncbi:MAG: hypothetical protein JW982_05180 [Spirochaetes bacterium]|nr:hypothetical protein [Spirochaetota bacterium]
MRTANEIIDDILETVSRVAGTAAEVNKNSVLRKDITENSVEMCEMLSDETGKFIENFLNIKTNLNSSMELIQDNDDRISGCTGILSSIISDLTDIKNDLSGTENEIIKLTGLVDEIRNDTDDIFSLALNAAIVSSKYSNTSGVFDILANKLNEMSNFITQNLENIVNVVRPITEGVSRLVDENDIIMKEISKGTNTFVSLPEALENQNSVLGKLIGKGLTAEPKINKMAEMLNELKHQLEQMDSDAKEAIAGSSSVRNFAENLVDDVSKNISVNTESESGMPDDFILKIENIKKKSENIHVTASNVNKKSKNQLSFTEGCLEITNSIYSFTNELKDTAVAFNLESEENDESVTKISSAIVELVDQLKSTETKILHSNDTIQAFNEDYKKIDNIIEFLKNILKSMHLIGMYSRIESARDIDQYEGFMNISANISKSQTDIQNNIPKIESNISDTHLKIDKVNRSFKKIYADFTQITDVSKMIIRQLNEMINISKVNRNTINTILEISEKSFTHSGNLRKYLNKLTEVVRIPIEGSAANMERGQHVSVCCDELLSLKDN